MQGAALMGFEQEQIGDCTLYRGDCREILPTLGHVDAVVTDPPYGIQVMNQRNATRSQRATSRDYGPCLWDNAVVAPDIIALCRAISQWQIIFGGNYYDLPPTSCWLIWDKMNGNNDFADCELAWTNLPKAVRRLCYLWHGCLRQERHVARVHPTQKPVGVMTWCLRQLPQRCNHICDPFMGSGTTGIACVQLGFSFVGIELERCYFDLACQRIGEAQRQGVLFPAPAVAQQLRLVETSA